MKTGILGGTFDPPHFGHIKLGQNAKKLCSLDRVLILPSANPPHKKSAAESNHRLNLAKIVADEYGFELCDIEYKKSTPSYTFETIRDLKELYPHDKFYFIIGGDSMRDFEKWYRWQELITMCAFIVGARTEEEKKEIELIAEDKKNRCGAEVYVISADAFPVSSTDIRMGEDLDKIPPSVKEYIEKNSLY